MLRLIGFLVVVALVIGGLGYYQGWFKGEVGEKDKKKEIHVEFDGKKFEKDREEYLKKVEASLKALDDELEKLRGKANKSTGEAKDAMHKEISSLHDQKEAARKKIAEIKNSTADKWEGVKAHLEEAFEDLKKGFKKAADSFK